MQRGRGKPVQAREIRADPFQRHPRHLNDLLRDVSQVLGQYAVALIAHLDHQHDAMDNPLADSFGSQFSNDQHLSIIACLAGPDDVIGLTQHRRADQGDEVFQPCRTQILHVCDTRIGKPNSATFKHRRGDGRMSADRLGHPRDADPAWAQATDKGLRVAAYFGQIYFDAWATHIAATGAPFVNPGYAATTIASRCSTGLANASVTGSPSLRDWTAMVSVISASVMPS